MISGLIDELNKSADEWNGSNMFELARMCREAADTIWQLRDDLQRANAAVQDAEHDESMAWDRVRKAEAENAKLRELLRGWQVYAIDNTFGDIYKSEDVVDSNVVTFCDKHGYRLYTSMEVYGLLHDPNANERILTHDELPETIPCSEVFADIDV